MRAEWLALPLATCIGWGQQVLPADAAHDVAGNLNRRVVAEQLSHADTNDRIKAYERMLASSPDDPQIQGALISAYLQKLRESADYAYLDRAGKLVDRMLEKDGGNFAALRFQNEIDMQRHDFKAVAERAEDMARYAPSDPGSWGNLGDARMELGEYAQAGQAYEKMFALRPNLASYNRLAYFRFVTGDAGGAIALMRDAIATGDPIVENTAWCWAELGDMYFKTGKLPEAEESYRSALSLFPALHRASAGLGKIEAARGNLQAAIKNFHRAQSIVPLVEYAGALEDLYAAAGMPREAGEQRDLVATIAKLGKINNEKTNRNLALLLADHSRDLNLALNLIEAEIPVRGDVYTWDALSWVLFQNGRLQEAMEANAKALKLATPEPLFYYHASRIASASGDQQSANDYTRRLTALNAHFDFAKTGPVATAARR